MSIFLGIFRFIGYALLLCLSVIYFFLWEFLGDTVQSFQNSIIMEDFLESCGFFCSLSELLYLLFVFVGLPIIGFCLYFLIWIGIMKLWLWFHSTCNLLKQKINDEV